MQVEFVKKECIHEHLQAFSCTPAGIFLHTIFGATAQLERAYILDRQRKGSIAKQYPGRKKIENKNLAKIYKEWKADNITAVRAMELLGMKRNTFFRRVAEYEN